MTCSQFRLFLNSKIVFYNWHTKFQLFFCSNTSAFSQPNHYTKMRTFHSVLFSINTVQPAVFILLSRSAKSAIQLSTSVRSAFQIWFQKRVLLSPALNPNIERIKKQHKQRIYQIPAAIAEHSYRDTLKLSVIHPMYLHQANPAGSDNSTVKINDESFSTR